MTPPSEPRVSPVPSAGLNLLLVDDQRSQLKLMTLLLQHAFPGCRTVELQDPSTATECVRVEDFDCVIADYQMPELNGVELAAQLRAIKPYLPVVLCTGGGDEMLVAEAMTNGITQYLPKTRLNPESLRRTVAHAIQITSHERLIAEQQQEIEHFSYALAHDFKQPLRQIKTFSQLIENGIDGDDKEAVKQHAEFLSKAAGRLARLVDVMSQYALLRKAPELAEVRIEAVLADLQDALEPYVHERGGELRLEARGALWGNETLLHQILQNLIINGLKYNVSRTPTVSVRSSVENGRFEVRVKDNGIGIPEEFHEKIFLPLARLHTANEYEGSGLGLALARKAAVSQNGSIDCVSEPGSGSEFIIALPAASSETAPILTH